MKRKKSVKTPECAVCHKKTDRIDEQFKVFVCSKWCEELLLDLIVEEMHERGDLLK